VHAVAAALPDGDEEALAAAVDARWSELELPEGWVGAAQRRRAASIVRHLAAYLRDAGEPVAVERPFTVEVGRVVLRGVVDRLERVVAEDGGPRLRVVDLKTGKQPVAKGEAQRHPQLGAYQLAVEAGQFDDLLPDAPDGARSAGAALVYVGTSQKTFTTRDQPPLAEDADPAWAADLVADVADAVCRSAVTASAGDLCRTCAVQRSCPLQEAGRVVGA